MKSLMKSSSLGPSIHPEGHRVSFDASTPKSTKVAWPKTTSNYEKRVIYTKENRPKSQCGNFFKQIEDSQSEITTRKTPNNDGVVKIQSLFHSASARVKKTTDSLMPGLTERLGKNPTAGLKDFLNSKIIDDKAIIQRSYKLSQMRKSREESERIDKINPEIKSCRTSPKLVADKTLTRFVDKLILTGSLPLEAVEYFSPENQTNKMEKKKFILNSHRPKTSSFSANPSPRKAKEKDDSATNLALDIVPSWMKLSLKSPQLSVFQKKVSQNPLSKILLKEPAERDLAQTTFIAKWLGGIQILSKLPYEKLVDLSKILEPVFLHEGEVLCNVQDQADCAYIVYEGLINIYTGQNQSEKMIGKAGPGDVLSRQALEQPGKRGIKLSASQSSFLVGLHRNHYQAILAEIKATPPSDKGLIYNFIESHDFLRTFTEVKKHLLANNLQLRRFLKNEIVYEMGSVADAMFIVMSGRVVRTIPVTMDKTNKWPTGVRDWRICKVIKTYEVTLPIKNGEIFGVSEMIDVAKRKEDILVDEDAEILVLTRSMFYKIFEEDDIFRFTTKVREDDRRKAENIKKMFKQQDNLDRVKAVAMSDAFNFNLNTKTHFSFREITEKTAAWKRFEGGMTKPKSKDKVVISVQEIIKDVHSVYET